FHLAADVIDRIPRLSNNAVYFKQYIRDKLIDHKQYIYKHGEDMPEIQNWQWPYAAVVEENDSQTN
ncbi:MAG: phosphoketolase family protein, partial [Methylobacter sp.]